MLALWSWPLKGSCRTRGSKRYGFDLLGSMVNATPPVTANVVSCPAGLARLRPIET